GHEHPELGRIEAPLLVLLHVLLAEDRLHDRRVRRRTADALLLELLDERRLREARRRLREMLVLGEVEERELVALGERGQRLLVVLGARLVAALRVHA